MNKAVLILSVAVVAIVISYAVVYVGNDYDSSPSNLLSISYVDTNKEL